VISEGGMAIATVRDFRSWGRRTITGDFMVWAALPEIATADTVQLPDDLRNKLQGIEGIKDVDSIRLASGQAGGHAIIVIARGFDSLESLSLDLRRGDLQAVYQGLHHGETVIGTRLAAILGLGVGDFVPLKTPRGTQVVRIAGIANSYIVNGNVLYLQSDTAKRLLAIDGVDGFLIDAVPRRRHAAETALRAFCTNRGLILQSSEELRTQLVRMTNGIVAGLWTLMLLGVVVASCGVGNTLTMDVLEQTREIGLLRVVGMTQHQVRSMVLVESLLLAFVGFGPGTLVGILLIQCNLAAGPQLLGHEFVTPAGFGELAGCLMVGVVIVLAAAWFPARKAASLDLTAAIYSE